MIARSAKNLVRLCSPVDTVNILPAYFRQPPPRSQAGPSRFVQLVRNENRSVTMRMMATADPVRRSADPVRRSDAI